MIENSHLSPADQIRMDSEDQGETTSPPTGGEAGDTPPSLPSPQMGDGMPTNTPDVAPLSVIPPPKG